MNLFRKTLGALLAVVIALGALAAAPVSASAKSSIKGTVYDYDNYGTKYSCNLETMKLTITPADTSRELHFPYSMEDLESKIKKITIKPGIELIYGIQNYTSLESVELPDTVKTIEDHAFKNCSKLKNISFDDVERVDKNVLSNTAIYNDFMNSSDEVLYVGNCLVKAKPSLSGSYEIREGTTCIAYGAFKGCKSLTAISIPGSVTGIPNSAFDGCTSLTDVSISEGVTGISDSAFKGCTSLTDVSIFEGVTGISDSAFLGCTSLTSITIPDSVTNIGYNAFKGCSVLSNIQVGDNIRHIEQDAFKDTAFYFGERENGALYLGKYLIDAEGDFIDFEIKEGTTLIADTAFNFARLNSVKIPDSVRVIGNCAFWWQGYLKELVLPEGVEEIGAQAFYECSLTSVEFPSTLKKIGYDAFSFCENLKHVYINDLAAWCGVEIDECLDEDSQVDLSEEDGDERTTPFYNASDLYIGGKSVTKLEIPEGVERINNYAFAYCGAIKSVKIPDSVKEIGKAAFYRSGIEKISIGTGVEDIGVYAFTGTNCLDGKKYRKGNAVYFGNYLIRVFNSKSNSSFAVKDGTIGIAEEAFERCSNITSVKLPKGLKYICDKALAGCASMKKIKIPASVKKIGSYAVAMDEIWEYGDYANYVVGYVADKNSAIYGEKGSVAEKYAKEYGVVFNKLANPLKASAKKVTISLNSLKKGKVTVEPLTSKGAKGAVSYKATGRGYDPELQGKYTINKKTGALTIKKGSYKKGTHELYISVKAKGKKGYAPKTIDVLVSLKIK